MTEQEAERFVASSGAADWPALKPHWQTAAATVGARGATAYEPPDVRELEPAAQTRLGPVLAHPLYRQQAANFGAEIRAIEIDKLIVYQQFVDSQFSLDGQANGAPDTRDAALVERCFPLAMNERIHISVDADGSAASVISLTRNLYVGPAQIQPPRPNAPPMVSFPIVVSPNWTGVAEVGGRYYLTNGYHRTWLLRHLGVQHVPALLTHYRSVDEIGMGPGFFSHALVTSGGAPRFSHFFDDEVAVSMQLKSTLTVLRFEAGRSVLPRLP